MVSESTRSFVNSHFGGFLGVVLNGRATTLAGFGPVLRENGDLRVWVPVHLSAWRIDLLEAGQKLAYNQADLVSGGFRSVQLKGDIRHVGSATDIPDEAFRQFRASFAEMLTAAGVPDVQQSAYLDPFASLSHVPVDVRITEIYDQSPRQGTGEVLETL